MKLQIAFDSFDLEYCLKIAHEVESYAHRFEISAPLLYKYGIEAVHAFRKEFPHKEILAETQIISHGKDITSLYMESGADWITVMAKANNPTIHAACGAAQKRKKLIMLDLLYASNFEQAAMNAKTLGVDALLFHLNAEEKSIIAEDQWEMTRGNSDLPIYIASKIDRNNIDTILKLKPNGIVLGKAITQAACPQEEAAFFFNLCT